MRQLSELIQQSRKKRGISRRELARRSRVSEAEIRQIEKDEGNPKIETLEKLAGPLGLTLEDLLLTRLEFLGLTAAASAGIIPTDYEGQALAAQVAEDWSKAELLWLLVADSAAQIEDWPTWANAMLQASQMALNLSRFNDAKSKLEIVIRRSGINAETKVEAFIRLGWVAFEEENYRSAKTLLSQGIKKVKELLLKRKDNPSLVALLEMGCHFLGRTMIALGEQTNDEDELRNALHYLNHAYEIDKKSRSSIAMGFTLLRQIPVFIQLEDESLANRSLDGAKEYLAESGTIGAHINYHRALLSIEGLLLKTGRRSPKPVDFLDQAARGFIDPVFYPTGLADVFLEIGNLPEYSNNPKDIGALKLALEYLLVASILHPYERSLGEIQVMAQRLYYRMSSQQF